MRIPCLNKISLARRNGLALSTRSRRRICAGLAAFFQVPPANCRSFAARQAVRRLWLLRQRLFCTGELTRRFPRDNSALTRDHALLFAAREAAHFAESVAA